MMGEALDTRSRSNKDVSVSKRLERVGVVIGHRDKIERLTGLNTGSNTSRFTFIPRRRQTLIMVEMRRFDGCRLRQDIVLNNLCFFFIQGNTAIKEFVEIK